MTDNNRIYISNVNKQQDVHSIQLCQSSIDETIHYKRIIDYPVGEMVYGCQL